MGQDLLSACSSRRNGKDIGFGRAQRVASLPARPRGPKIEAISASLRDLANFVQSRVDEPWNILICLRLASRSEEHTSELQSLMRISYAVFCLKKKKKTTKHNQDKLDTKNDTHITKKHIPDQNTSTQTY